MRKGALPSQMLVSLLDGGAIKNGDLKNISPSSLDLTLTDEVYRISGMVLPCVDESIRDLLHHTEHCSHDFSYPLERNVLYLAKLRESLELPRGLYGYCNPKSSTGRTDVHVRVMTDGVSRYDAITDDGKAKDVWLLIAPKSFPVLLSPGETLTQLRIFNNDTKFDELALKVACDRDKLIWSAGDEPHAFSYNELIVSDQDGSIILSLDATNDIVGWECLGSSSVLDFSKRAHYEPEDFFRPLQRKDGMVRMKQGGFYILYTRERVRVPSHLACEMVPVDERSGEFRSHYAGFIDPGWGWGADGDGIGRKLVLEVRPNEDLLFRDNQPIAKITFEYMAELPESSYDTKSGSNYTIETSLPKLSKHFI
ncbi:MAG: 2'-deoxycytidine 5'-triphosphate deaminase [bacterium]|nr:2'-deoxycytidine 5'-triphosphate deaminase [bacterium]